MSDKRTAKIFLALMLAPLYGAHALTTARHANTTTLLPDGDILVTGGVIDTANTPTAATEIFFSSSGSWGLGPAMTVARSSHTATLLSDGRVLITGGFNTGTPLQSAEIYDPRTGTWALVLNGVTPCTDEMCSARGGHTATLINKGSRAGSVLLCGGQTTASVSAITNSCEFFNTGANNFSAAATMTSSRMGHTACSTGKGTIFVSGGKVWDGVSQWTYLPTNEIYDPQTNQWIPVTSLLMGRTNHSATTLNNGNVFIAGGYNEQNVYDIKTEAWHYKNVTNQNAGNRGILDSAEIFDPNGGRVMVSGEDSLVLPYRNSSHSAILSPDGAHHMTGGYGNIIPTFVTPSVVLESGSSLALNRISVSTAAISASSSLRFLLDTKLSRTVDGRIVDGDFFISLPVNSASQSIGAYNLKVYLNRSTAPLDGSPVGLMISSSARVSGDFSDILQLQAPTGIAVFDPQITASRDGLVAGSQIVFAGPLAAGANLPLNASSWINQNVIIPVPAIYIGGVITGSATLTSGALTASNGTFSLTLTGGVGDLNSGTVTRDPDTGEGLVTTTIRFDNLAGTILNSTDTALSSPKDVTGATLTGLALTLNYTATPVNLSGSAYDFDVSTIVIRGMIFSDDLRYDPAASKWEFKETMASPSFSHTALLTPAADMLMIGGKNCDVDPYASCLRTVQSYTPRAPDAAYIYQRRETWLSSGKLAAKRAFHTSTLLPDGTILTCGGSDGTATLATCELLGYDKTWAPAGSMNYPRARHTATLLPNGAVLASGGATGDSGSAVETAEIYYPDTKRWVLTDPMNSPRQNHTATLLPDGNVLVAGGGTGSAYSDTAEIFITSMTQWQSAGTMVSARAQHTATLLKNGNVLAAGGLNGSGGLSSSEIYNWQSRAWAAGPAMNKKRFSHTANLLKDGRVITIGGSDNVSSQMTSEIYDGAAWTYSRKGAEISEMQLNRTNHKSVLLPNGKILATGGESAGVAQGYAEGYDVEYSSWQPQGAIQSRSNHTSVLMNDGSVINIGGWDGTQYLDSTDLAYFSYDPDLSGLDPKAARNPAISTGTVFLDRGQRATLISGATNFHGLTEASGGGGGPMNSSFQNPRVYLQAIDSPSGFLTDLTTRFYTLYGGPNTSWEQTLSSITVIVPSIPGELPYGWYHMRVAANGQFSNAHTVQITLPRPTGLPDAAAGTVLDQNSIQWTWTQGSLVSGENNGYAIFSSTNGLFVGTAAFTSPASYIQKNLPPNTAVSIKVAGYNIGGTGSFQMSPTYHTLAAAPQALTVTAASFETVGLTWNPMGNSDATIYELSVSQQSNFSSEFVAIPFTNNHTSTSAVITSLTPNVMYYFRVRARNSAGVTTLYDRNTAPYVSTITVGNINSLSGTPLTMSAINWSWDPSLGNPSYEIYDVTAGTAPGTAVFLASTTVNSFTQTALSTNTAHAVSVNAFVGANKGPAAYSEAVYTLAVQPLPYAPAFSGITSSGLTLNWIANGNPSGTRYNVSYANDINFTSPVAQTTTGTAVSLTGLSPNKQYFARVSAMNESNLETSSVSLGTAYTLAQPPTNLRPAEISMSGITLTWNVGTNPASTWYEVRFTTNPGFTGTVTKLKSFAQAYTANTLSINGLLTATTYYFDVAAMNGAFVETARTQCVPAAYTLPGPGGAPGGSLGGTSDPSRDVMIAGLLPDGRAVSLTVPSGAFPTQTAIAISSSATNSCGQSGIPVVEVQVYTQNNAQPQVPVTLNLSYDGPAWATIDAKRQHIVLGRYNPVSGDCLPLDTLLSPGNRTITANLNHFSIFQLMEKTAASSLSAVRVYPNPFYTNRFQGFITIDNLPAAAKVKIYTLSGEKVWEGTAGTTGILTWNAVNKSGVMVGSGIYLAVIDSSAGKKVVKIAVER